jgi:hypothetical protein
MIERALGRFNEIRKARVIADIATVSYPEGYHSSHPALKKPKRERRKFQVLLAFFDEFDN